MRISLAYGLVVGAVLLSCATLTTGAGKDAELKPDFHTSDRCMACHNGLTTPSGQDVSIGFDWRASVMANSARDPYWQASVRRETIDHPEARSHVEDECSVCHMPVSRYEAKLQGREGEVFAHLPFPGQSKASASAEDGVTCSVCHQISNERLGTRESFSGKFVVEAPPSKDNRPEYGQYAISLGNQRVMESSTGGFRPTQATHIQDSAMCGSCHQLYTIALGKDGKVLGEFPEQVPYLEWLHSDYPKRSSCVACHMTEVQGFAPISAVQAVPRPNVRQHVFFGGNFFLQRLLNLDRDDLDVAALPQELTTAAQGTQKFLQSQSARVTVRNVDVAGSTLRAEVLVQNLTGHKLPTAYPSRRAWLHFVVRDGAGHTVFESGALNEDGSIKGNDNDADATRFESHYREITSSEQVEIYEPILKDYEGKVTTGLLSTVGYLKDNRLLPSGFDKSTASKDIAVVGDAAEDPRFVAGGDTVLYSVPVGNAQGPFHVEAELWYQPIGFRWAHNLEAYESAAEPKRFLEYYKAMSSDTAIVLAWGEATR